MNTASASISAVDPAFVLCAIPASILFARTITCAALNIPARKTSDSSKGDPRITRMHLNIEIRDQTANGISIGVKMTICRKVSRYLARKFLIRS